jgi:hypothetical protein
MSPIPLYLKTSDDMPRPTDTEFYWLTQDGPFLCRNHPFFTSDVPTRRPIRALAPHDAACEINYPKVPQAILECVVGFFDRVYALHQSESVVLLLWDLGAKKYKVFVPDQEATVYESWSGRRSPEDVRYKVPTDLPARHLVVGDIHCHGNMAAFASWTDCHDEVHRDGVHVVVGKIENEPPEFHLEMAIDGHRFVMEMDDLFTSYKKRGKTVPKKWIDKVAVKLESARRFSWYSSEEMTPLPRKRRD